MRVSLVVALVVVSGSLVLFWNSRNNTTPVVETPAPVVEVKKEPTKKGKKKKLDSKKEESAQVVLDDEKLKQLLPGYWVSKSSSLMHSSNRKIQVYFTVINNPDLHDGKVIEGLIFTFDEKNPSKQSMAKLVLDKIEGTQVKFRVERKDVSKYSAGAYINEEDSFSEITIVPGKTLSVNAVNSYKEKVFGVGLHKLEVDNVLASYRGKWRGIRAYDNEKVYLNFSGLKNFNDDFGDFKISGTCFTDSQFKIRPIDEKVVLISVGNASCGASSIVYKSILGGSEMETIAYRQFDEAYEMRFKKD